MRIPFKFDLGSFYRKILCIFFQKVNFQVIFKKFYQEQRYRIFFFTRKSLQGTHTLVLGIFCFFFFPSKVKKKKQIVFFFFPRKSLHATHSTEKIQPAKKGKKMTKNGIFCRFSVFSLFFFFPTKNCFFFFPRKSLPTTHSLDFQRP